MINLSTLKKNFLLLIIFLFFLVVYSFIGIQRYHRFETADDLALYSQAVWHYSRFESPFSSFKNANLLTDHFGPILIIFTPLYWLWPDPRTLILGQQLIVVAGVIPVYLFSQKIFKKKWYSFVFSFLYLYFIGIQSAIIADFHLATISTTFLAFTIYFLEIKKWRLYWICLFLALICKEDVPSIIFALGIYVFLVKKDYKRGFLTILISLVYYYAIYNLFLPLINNQVIKLGPLGGKSSRILGLFFSSPFDFFRTFVYPEVKLRNIFLTSFSFGFLPFLSLLYWLVAPFTFFRFFSDPARYGLHFHYTATLTPILAFSAIKVLKKIKRQKVKIFFLILAIIGTFYTNKPELDSGFPTPPISFIFKRAFYVLPPRNDDYNKILSLIPKNSSISAQAPLLPYLCNRQKIYRFPEGYQQSTYIALTFTESPYPLSSPEYETIKQKILNDSEFEQLYLSYAGVLLKKKNIPK